MERLIIVSNWTFDPIKRGEFEVIPYFPNKFKLSDSFLLCLSILALTHPTSEVPKLLKILEITNLKVILVTERNASDQVKPILAKTPLLNLCKYFEAERPACESDTLIEVFLQDGIKGIVK